MSLDRSKEDLGNTIAELKDFISDKKQMLKWCAYKKEKLVNGLFRSLSEEYVSKRIVDEEELIEKLSLQIEINQEILERLEKVYFHNYS